MAHLVAGKLFNIAGRTAVVTGAGTGIGLMCAQTLAANGAKVYITGRREHVLQKSIEQHSVEGHGKIIALPCDVTSKDSIKEAVARVQAENSEISILVNNAGVNTKNADVSVDDNPAAISQAWFKDDTFEDGWDPLYRTNVAAPYFVTAAFIPLLAAGVKKFGPESSSVVTIASMSGITKTTQSGQFAYNSSKAATASLIKLLATELSRPSLRIRSVGISPGYFPSEMTVGESDDRTNKSKIDDTNYEKNKGVPADRSGAEEDMAQLLLMLVCNEYINGETVLIDGGRMLRHA